MKKFCLCFVVFVLIVCVTTSCRPGQSSGYHNPDIEIDYFPNFGENPAGLPFYKDSKGTTHINLW